MESCSNRLLLYIDVVIVYCNDYEWESLLGMSSLISPYQVTTRLPPSTRMSHAQITWHLLAINQEADPETGHMTAPRVSASTPTTFASMTSCIAKGILPAVETEQRAGRQRAGLGLERKATDDETSGKDDLESICNYPASY